MMGSLRSRASRAIRRAGLLPGGLPDGLGEDAALANLRLSSRVVVFFPDPPENLYQIRQWYAAFEALDATMGVTILTQDSRSARAIRTETHLPVYVTALTRTVGAMLEDGEVRVVLYVGQSNANAVAQRSARVAHVFLNHGESDKLVSISNQVKAFDFAFVGGQAAIDRHASGLVFFDAAARLRAIGRPQVPAPAQPAGATTILYAPTWEGTQAVNAYSTVRAFGARLIQSLLTDTDYNIIYRPHPRTGASDRTYRTADREIRALIAAHRGRAAVDTTHDATPTLQRAHLMIADISGIAADWLTQGRPLVTTTPAEPGARIAAPALMYERTPHVDVGSAHLGARIVTAALNDPAAPMIVARLFDHYLSGLHAEASLAAFVAACHEVAELRDVAVRDLESAHD